MAILYAMVARGTVVLVEFSAVTGNIGAVARRILEKIPSEADTRLCFSQDRFIFHILRSDGLSFLCMANDTFGSMCFSIQSIPLNLRNFCSHQSLMQMRLLLSSFFILYNVYVPVLTFDAGRVPFSYLEEIQMRFMKNYGKVAHYAPAYTMNDEFSRVLHQQMEFFSSNPSADALNRVRGEVSEIRTIMVENIEKILERGDRIELLVDKTATMQDGAFHFRKQSKRLRRALWMKNAKLLALLTIFMVLLLYFIIAAFCGGISLPTCRS